LAGFSVNITVHLKGGSSAPAFFAALIEMIFVGTQVA